MKKILLGIAMMLTMVLAPLCAKAQAVPVSMLPTLVAEMNKMCPQKVDNQMTMTKVSLVNNGSEMQFDFKYNLPSGVPSSGLIKEFDSMSASEKAELLGPEFGEVARMIPVPIYAKFFFSDGKTYRMRLS